MGLVPITQNHFHLTDKGVFRHTVVVLKIYKLITYVISSINKRFQRYFILIPKTTHSVIFVSFFLCQKIVEEKKSVKLLLKSCNNFQVKSSVGIYDTSLVSLVIRLLRTQMRSVCSTLCF